MHRFLSLFLALVFFFGTASWVTAHAAGKIKPVSLEQQIEEIRDGIKDNEQTVQKLERSVRRHTRQGKQQTTVAQRWTKAARSAQDQFDRERTALDKQTVQYVALAGAIGNGSQDSESAALGIAVDAQSSDAALVYATAGSLLERQSEVLSRLRAQATTTAQAQRAAIETAARAQVEVNRSGVLQDTAEDQLHWAKLNRVELRTTLHLTKEQLAKQQRGERIKNRKALLSNLVNIGGGDGIITDEQAQFSYQLAAITGMDVNVIRAWVLAEMSGDYAKGRSAEGNNNWLNIGYFDSLGGGGAFQKFGVWSDPVTAGNASAAFLYGKWLGASPGIQKIVDSRDKSPQEQINAIATSGWASSGYFGGASLRGTYRTVSHVKNPPRDTARVIIDKKTIISVPPKNKRD